MRISIITPSFNQGSYIGRTIESVLTQKGNFDLEYIVMDGASTDNTLSILEKTAMNVTSGFYSGNQNSVSFVYYSGPDGGQSAAINAGLKKATGEIVAYLNSDDLYLPGALEKVSTFFETNRNCSFVTGYCRIINERDQEILKWITAYKNRSLRNISFKKLLIENYISQPATFWHRSLHDTIGYFLEDLNYVMDYEMWLRIAQSQSICLISDYLAAFRRYRLSKSGSRFTRQFLEGYAISRRYIPSDDKFLHFRHYAAMQRTILVYHLIRGLGE